MSTIDDIPSAGVQQMPLRLLVAFLVAVKCQSYLELGVLAGESFRCASEVVPRCVGVDLSLHYQFAKYKSEDVVREMSTDAFFAQNTETFDVIMIDASHEFEQVRKDFDNSTKAMKPTGFILLHDTDPYPREFLQPQFCDDAYKIVDYVHGLGDFDILTLPTTNAGLSIVSRKDNRRVLALKEIQ